MQKKFDLKIKRFLQTPPDIDPFFSLGKLLFCFSVVYSKLIQFRAFLYRTGLLKTRSLPCFVISIGNLTAGGTGKTPMAIYISQYLNRRGFKVVILSRGYKGRFEKTNAVISDWKKIIFSSREAGDESFMLAAATGNPVVVGKNRHRSGRIAVKQFSPDIILLDDAFQHLSLRRDLNLLLLDAQHPFGNHCLLPRGLLREPKDAVLRSDALILTRSDKLKIKPDVKTTSTLPTFACSHKIRVAKVFNLEKLGISGLEQENILKRLTGLTCCIFSGIAKNRHFFDACSTIGLKVLSHQSFPDHYTYGSGDMYTVYRQFQNSQAALLATTWKDYVKISDIIRNDIPLLVLDVDIVFESDQKDLFEKFIDSYLDTYFATSPE